MAWKNKKQKKKLIKQNKKATKKIKKEYRSIYDIIDLFKGL